MSRVLTWISATVLIATILTPFLLFGIYSYGIYQRALLPQYEERAQVVAVGIERRLELGLRLFGELSQLRDIDQILANAALNSPETDFIVVTDRDGAVLAQVPQRIIDLEDKLTRPEAAAQSGIVERFQSFISNGFAPQSNQEPVATADQASHIRGDFLITRLEIGDDAAPAGYVYLATSTSLLEALKRELSLNMLIVLAAAILLGFECLLLIAGVSLLTPLSALRFLRGQLQAGDLRFVAPARGPFGTAEVIRQTNNFIIRSAARARKLGGLAGISVPDGAAPSEWRPPTAHLIRLPLIFFFLSEAILRPSLPLFLQGLAPLDVAPEMGVGLAMSAFLLASLGGILLGSHLCQRFPVKTAILIGIVISAAGTQLHVLGTTIVEIGAFRALAGLGYGVVYAAAQVYIVDHSEKTRRTTGFSLFFIAVVGADIAGPAIGGILADRLGETAAFAMATSALILSFMVTAAILPVDPPHGRGPAPVGGTRFGVLKALLTNRRFLALGFGLAIPSKLLLNGGLFLCLPLAVASFGEGAAVAGRLFMVYGIVVLLCSAWMARAIDRWNLIAPVVCAGTMLSAAALALPELIGAQWALMLCVVIFAVGQAMSVPTQMSFLLRLMQDEQKTYGSAAVIAQYRLLERLGSLLGPLIGALLISVTSPTQALLFMGLVAMLLSGLAATIFLIMGERDEEEAINELLVES